MMTSEELLQDVTENDPCGPNLQWDPAFTELRSAAVKVTSDKGDVIEASKASPEAKPVVEIIAMADALLRRTKDLRVLAMRAELSAQASGLAGFAQSMEELSQVVEKWPDPHHGIHPKADESDGDLGERAAPLGKLVYGLPGLIATTKWSEHDSEETKRAAVRQLKGVFEHWKGRLGPALEPELPVVGEIWQTLSARLPKEHDADAEDAEQSNERSGTEEDRRSASAKRDAWDLIEEAATRMEVQDRHSPARLLLEVMDGWRKMNLIEIADAMKASGISLEQLLESAKKQRVGRDPV